MTFRGFRIGAAVPALLAGALALGLTGCPQAQTPNTNNNNQDDEDVQQVTPSQRDEGALPRPVPQVDVSSGDTTTNGGNTGGAPAPGGNAGGGGTTNATVFITVQEPSRDTYVRPGADVTIVFDFLDAAGAAQQVDAVVGLDSDGDLKPDGDIRVVKLDVDPEGGRNSVTFNSNDLSDLLIDGYGRFVVGVRAIVSSGATTAGFSPRQLIVDAVEPEAEWVSPTADAILGRVDALSAELKTVDNSPHTLTLKFDPDTDPTNGNELLLTAANFTAGAENHPLSDITVSGAPAGTYFLLAQVDDKAGPATSIYAPNAAQAGQFLQIAVTNRMVGEFDLASLTNSNRGGILQGFNFNDLGGNALAGVPDLDGDGRAELLVASRFGKPFGVAPNGVGYGEAYLIYGREARIRGQRPLNATGEGDLPGIVFPGIRVPTQVPWTEGLSDVTVVDDMDGDDKPELVFSFPRAESISLQNTAASMNPVAPDIAAMGYWEWDALLDKTNPDPDVTNPMHWWRNTAQFTRGGVVIVSSHNEMISNRNLRNRKGNRVVDLHEVGQLFKNISNDGSVFDFNLSPASWPQSPFMSDSFSFDVTITCPEDQEVTYSQVFTFWDMVMRRSGPGGFMNDWTLPGLELFKADGTTGKRPPLSNFQECPYTLPGIFGRFFNTVDLNPCESECDVALEWLDWSPASPFTNLAPTVVDSWLIPSTPETPITHPVTGETVFLHTSAFPTPDFVEESPASVWSGFIALGGTAVSIDEETVGCRILGQAVDDRFGTTVSSDGTWLYVSAPERSALRSGDNVSTLPTEQRSHSGVVYQLRTDARPGPVGSPSVAQLWIEPGTRAGGVPIRYPYVDAEIPERQDWTMPTPHQFIIEEVGSIRGNDIDEEDIDGDGTTGFADDPTSNEAERENITNGLIGTFGGPAGDNPCYGPFTTTGGNNAVFGPSGSISYRPASTGQAAYHMDDVPQIVGPHPEARISFVRSVGDMNDDGVNDVAVGSQFIHQNVAGATGPQVGAIFIVFGRPTGLEGHMLLERMALPLTDANRLEGVLLRGSSTTDQLARVIDGIGDFNGDGVDDVIVGNQGADIDGKTNAGEAVILLGSATLAGSPAGGWTVPQMLAEQPNRVIRFRGENANDLAGANVASAGDIDGDGLGDVLISAPAARGQKGVVYLVYGAANLGHDVELAKVGSVAVPGVKLIGRNAGDMVGGGEITYPNAGANVFLQPSGQPGDDARNVTVNSRGIVGLGDIDGDGRGDFAVSSILASPNNKQHAGEVYILYGSGD